MVQNAAKPLNDPQSAHRRDPRLLTSAHEEPSGLEISVVPQVYVGNATKPRCAAKEAFLFHGSSPDQILDNLTVVNGVKSLEAGHRMASVVCVNSSSPSRIAMSDVRRMNK